MKPFLLLTLLTTALHAGEARLPDGRLYRTGVLRVTFHDDFAARVSLDGAGKAKAVRAADLTSLHGGIARTEAKHLSSREWLAGRALPGHLKKAGKVPRIARNVNVVLQPGTDTLQAATELRQRPEVERVSLIVLYEVQALPNDPLYAQLWGMSRIGVPDGDWDTGIPGRGRIRVAVVDSGIDRQHPDLAARIVFGAGYNSDSPADGDAPADRRNNFDHGTHVAGIVAAIRNNSTGVAGVSNNIDLMAMGCATWSTTAPAGYRIGNTGDAMDDAVANGARVMNCSFGVDRANGRADLDGDKNDALNNARDNNVLVVVSAGNAAMDTTNHDWSQSAVPFIVSAAMRSNPVTNPEVFNAVFSNFGPRIDLCAPGTGIQSTLPTGGPAGTALYGSKDGTSMAAPHVAGAAGHVISMNPARLGDDAAKHLLVRMSQDAGPAGKDNQYGWGLLRLRRESLQVLRDADLFACSADFSFAPSGSYEEPIPFLSSAVTAVPNGGTIVLNGGDVGNSEFYYPAITITKPCVLKALPDKRVIIGQ